MVLKIILVEKGSPISCLFLIFTPVEFNLYNENHPYSGIISLGMKFILLRHNICFI